VAQQLPSRREGCTITTRNGSEFVPILSWAGFGLGAGWRQRNINGCLNNWTKRKPNQPSSLYIKHRRGQLLTVKKNVSLYEMIKQKREVKEVNKNKQRENEEPTQPQKTPEKRRAPSKRNTSMMITDGA
jgi:hypothetical protein